MSEKWGYCRCSLDDSHQDVARQVAYCRRNGVPEDHIFSEYASGAKDNRKEYLRLLSSVQDGDEIFCTELSRMSRSVSQLCKLLDFVVEHRLRLVCDVMDIDARNGKNGLSPMTVAYYQMAGVFAQLERAMTSERVKSGLENAKRKGKKLGRRSVSLEDIAKKNPLFVRYYEDYRSGNMRLTDFEKITGLARNTIYKYCTIMEGGNKTK